MAQVLRVKAWPDFDPAKIRVYVQPPYLEHEEALFQSYGYVTTKNPNDADIVVFTGGSDINPALYGEEPIVGGGVHFSYARDKYEIRRYRASTDKFKVGLCRGGQLLNVLSGGKLWQDMNGHGNGDHLMRDEMTGEEVLTSSVHHQGFLPARSAVVVATCRVSTIKRAMNKEWRLTSAVPATDKGQAVFNYLGTDYEVLWYPETRSLCFQGHPGWADEPCQDYFFSLIERFYLPKEKL